MKKTMLLLALIAVAAPAQTPVEKRKEMHRIMIAAPGQAGAEDVMMWRHEGGEGAFAGPTFEFISSEMSFDASPVKGAPYSAEGINETSQTLADGNRINRKNTSVLYRDSEGRTRREQSLAAIGPWAAQGGAHQTIFINDPVAGVHWVLDPEARTARKMNMPEMKAGAVAQFKARGEGGGPGGRGPAAGITIEEFATVNGVRFEKKLRAPDHNVKTESLGQRVIEGIEAQGTRTTMTIPAGQIGNDRPIEIVSERWFSPQLKTVVMSKRTDPRQGDTVHRLTNIRLAEPLRSLFEPPPDYTVKEQPGPGMKRVRQQ